MQIIRARGSESPIDVIKENYPGHQIIDAVLFSPNKQIYVGFAGDIRPIPILDYLLLNDEFYRFINQYEGNLLIENGHLIYGSNTTNLPENIVQIIKDGMAYFSTYGGELNEDGEHIIDLKSIKVGPHYDVNLLLGDRRGYEEPLLTTPKSVVNSFGGGSFRGPANFQVLATRWDMRPEENGNPFNRQFYLVEDGKQIFYSANVNENVKEACAIHKVNKTEIYYETNDGLKIKRTIFMLPQLKGAPIAVESQSVEVKNLTNRERNIKIVFTGMFGSSNPNCQMVDVIYQSVINQTMLLKENDQVVAIAPDYYPEYCKRNMRFFILKDDNGYADDFSYDAASFLGNGDIEHPQYVNRLNNEYKVKGPSFFALDKKAVLKPNASITFDTYVGVVDASKTTGDDNLRLFQDEISNLLSQVKTHHELEKIIAKREKYLKDFSSFFQVESDDPNFDNYINKNLPFQILYQTYVSRAFAQTQKGYREIGFREIQDIYASMYYYLANGEIKVVRSLLEKWIVNVYEFGYTNHNFFYEGKEPGMCSDDGLWLVDAVHRYVALSNDISFLNKRFNIAGKNKKRTLYETLKAIIAYSSKISVGKHGLPLLDKADWNDCLKIDDDCLDGPTKEKIYKNQLKKSKNPYGTPLESELSESVMNAFMLVIMLDDMKDLATRLGDASYVEELGSSKDKIIKSLKENAYINGYYARVLINREKPLNGITYIGAPKDGLSLEEDFDGSIYLNSFSWSVLSGVASEEEIASMIKLVDKYLKTPAGYKLCSKHNLLQCGAKEAATEQYFPGDRENGGVFKHATMMFVDALFKAIPTVKDEVLRKTLIADAYYMLDIVYPYKTLDNPYLHKGNPRWCTQYVNSITNEHIGPILSGTSTWLLLSTLESFGLRFEEEDIKVRPVLRDEKKGMTFHLHIQNAYYDIFIEPDSDFKEITIPYFRDNQRHSIKI